MQIYVSMWAILIQITTSFMFRDNYIDDSVFIIYFIIINLLQIRNNLLNVENMLGIEWYQYFVVYVYMLFI